MKKTTINKIMKIITVLVIIGMFASVLSSVFATGASEILNNLTGKQDAANKITPIANQIIGIVKVICYAAAIIMLIFLGVKFITASPEAKADIKKSAIYYVIGAIVVLAAGALLGVISSMSTQVVNSK